MNESDEVWHAGDIGTTQVTDTISNLKPLRAVFGNIDNHELRLSFPKELVFECEGYEYIYDSYWWKAWSLCKGYKKTNQVPPAQNIYLWSFTYFKNTV